MKRETWISDGEMLWGIGYRQKFLRKKWMDFLGEMVKINNKITIYDQLIEEINECAALWHGEGKGDNLKNAEMLTVIEYDVGRAITEQALSKGLDYDIGRMPTD